jgi:hypothetical protein
MHPTEHSTDEPNLITAQPLVPSGQPSKGSRLISKVLSPAVQFWLRAQVEAISGLKFQIQGSDREILRGCVPSVEVQAEQIIYQGLHLSQVDLAASQIQINLGQVLQGKPLRLLEVVPVVGIVRLTQADLDASIDAPLLKQALADFLTLVLNHFNQITPDRVAELAILQPVQLARCQIQLIENGFTLTANLDSQQAAQVTLKTQLRLSQGSHLRFDALEIHYTSPHQPPTLVNTDQPLVIDLGSEVHLQKLELMPDGVLCEGRVNVISAG